MYDICCVPFFFSKNRLSKILFSNPFPKKRTDWEFQKYGFGFDLKNPPECRCYGFMIRFWIYPKKREIRFWIRIYGFGLSPKNAPVLHVYDKRQTSDSS